MTINGRVATAALLLMVAQYARAAEPKVITLSCDGTITDTSSRPLDPQPKPIEKMGVVPNLTEGTVSFMGWTATPKELTAIWIV